MNEFDAELQPDFDNDTCCLDEQTADFDGDDNLSDVEADAMTLASSGMGMDEDYYHDTPMGEDFGGE